MAIYGTWRPPVIDRGLMWHAIRSPAAGSTDYPAAKYGEWAPAVVTGRLGSATTRSLKLPEAGRDRLSACAHTW